MIRIGLPKGVIKEKSLDIIRNLIGEDVNEKKLSFNNNDYHIYLLKHRDIPKMIEADLLDIGVTSTEWVEENQCNVNIIKTLEWCNTRVCLIFAKEKEEIGLGNVKCVTEFPNIAKAYFKEKKIECEIYHISGSSEACVDDMFDCCVDCVETGSTLDENNLIIKDTILHSKVAVISQKKYQKDDPLVRNIIEVATSIG